MDHLNEAEGPQFGKHCRRLKNHVLIMLQGLVWESVSLLMLMDYNAHPPQLLVMLARVDGSWSPTTSGGP